MSCLVEKWLKLENGTFCDMDVQQRFSVNNIPYLKNCTQLTIDVRMEGVKTPFAKFSYKPKDGYDLFQYRNVTDEDNGIYYLIFTQLMTAKAKVGVVIFDYVITIPDNLRPVTGFNDPFSKQMFKFIDYAN